MEIDLTQFAQQPLDMVLLQLFLYFGWIPIAIAMLWGLKEIWIDYIQEKWAVQQKFILLAIDIPRNNTQSPKAVENIFNYLAGAHGNLTLIDKYWTGKFQLAFSLELVSIDGYTQFLIHTPESFRNLVESAFYSQYPDAEITEVNDYTEGYPSTFPDDEWDIWGAEFLQVKDPAYPIKSYMEFRTEIGEPEEQFKDPMASLMDLYSSLQPGEQAWWQIIIVPTLYEWVEGADKAVGKIMGDYKPKVTFANKVIDGILDFLNQLGSVFGLGGESAPAEEKKPLSMMELRPHQKKVVEALRQKASKTGYLFKTRFIYLAKKDLMNKPKVVNGFVGFMKQFVDVDLNNLKPDTKITGTSAAYFFTDYRLKEKKRKIMKNYKGRSVSAGRKLGVLNVEEIATLWHFPIEAVVKAPLIQKAPGRKSEPPSALPYGLEERDRMPDFVKEKVSIFEEKEGITPPEEEERPAKPKVDEEDIFAEDSKAEHRGAPPGNLPFA